ncbi:hypothetical protein D1224_10905 [Henriciella barbarensis]|uniref:Uncharacterized protein n=1 Tax=Henriciella barbarensis TaxID=86342 RepID=A0A399QTF1_9PROT|nr:hypothetical protein D1224_10905 [Henriciella barbarensis]
MSATLIATYLVGIADVTFASRTASPKCVLKDPRHRTRPGVIGSGCIYSVERSQQQSTTSTMLIATRTESVRRARSFNCAAPNKQIVHEPIDDQK